MGYPTDLYIKHARVNATSDGDNTVVAAVAGKHIRVLGYVLVASAAGAVTLKDSASTFAVFPLAANGGVAFAGSFECPAFQTGNGLALVINNAASVDTTGHISYCEA